MTIEPIYVGTLLGAVSRLLAARFFTQSEVFVMLGGLSVLAMGAALCFFEPASVFSAGLTGLVMGGVALLNQVDHLRTAVRQDAGGFKCRPTILK